MASLFSFSDCLPADNPGSSQNQQPKKWGNHYSPSQADKQEAADAKKAVENQNDPKHPLYFPSHHGTRPHQDKEDGKDDHTRHRYIGTSARTSGRNN